MDDDCFDLSFGSLKVGEVTLTASDFPNLWGKIAYDSAHAEQQSPELARFNQFLELDRQSMKLIDVEHERDVSEELSAINAQLKSYRDYIDSADWYLIDKRGRKLPILCPVLRDNGEIVWRWGSPEETS
jgi:hypothetical protein